VTHSSKVAGSNPTRDLNQRLTVPGIAGSNHGPAITDIKDPLLRDRLDLDAMRGPAISELTFEVALSKAVARLRNRRSGSRRPKSVEHGSPEGQVASRFLGRLATCRDDACLDGRESAVAVRARRGHGDYDDRPRPSGLGRHRYSPGRRALPPSSGRDSFLAGCCSLAWFWRPRPPIASGSVYARVLGVSSGMRTVPI